MKQELFPFQKQAVCDMRKKAAAAIEDYRRTQTPQILSLQAPTGSGKTVMMAAFVEDVLFGTAETLPGETGFMEQPDAIFVWLSDSPELNLQSKDKIELGSDRLPFGTATVISEESFDREMLEDGRLYFLNTQKLSVQGNLTRRGDARQWTIWETFENTAREKWDRLYFIIDEAHRGMQGTEAGKASSIMQRFLKGYRRGDVEMRPMPLVIGMSATAERFNRLAEGLDSTVRKTVVPAERVRASGLLKDRILIGYPADASRQDDLALLVTATDEWLDKCAHWEQYCREQHYRNVDPVLVVQVKAGTGDAVSDTDLGEVVAKIESRMGARLGEWEVVHTFGSTATLDVNGLAIHPVEPSRIAEDHRVKVVLFKENLSTGWDCPRAETMMSFRTARDATYIAQLLGRMIRTPLQNRVRVDDSLNEVKLFLPYFDEATVRTVIDELRTSECGDIPVDVEGEAVDDVLRAPWTIHPRRRAPQDVAGQQTFDFGAADAGDGAAERPLTVPPPQATPDPIAATPIPVVPPAAGRTGGEAGGRDARTQTAPVQMPLPLEIDRAAVIKAINARGLVTFVIRNAQINDYLKSVLDLSGLLTRTGVCPTAQGEVEEAVVGFIRSYVEQLRAQGRYDALARDVASFRLSVKVLDPFGNVVKDARQGVLAFSDLDRKVDAANMRLGNYGFAAKYGRRYATADDVETYKTDVILYAADEANLAALYDYAKAKFHELDDRYRRYMSDRGERVRQEYDAIVANGDLVSKHSFELPEDVCNGNADGGRRYVNHLYVDETGVAVIRLNDWEDGVIEEEERRPDFVCWLRNVPNAKWALRIPYDAEGVKKAMYPDFLVVRRDPLSTDGFVFDLLEPHSPALADNLQKAKGLAQYAGEETKFGRIQLIRKVRDAGGRTAFRRLDFCKGEIRAKVLRATTLEELNGIFASDGFTDSHL